MANPPSAMTRAATETLRKIAANPPGADQLALALRHLAKWRSAVIGNTLANLTGTSVLSGPFKGMDYAVSTSEGSRSARLIGAYEASLAPIIEQIIARSYDLVIDIGSAEGYYAVGLARRMPNARIIARDDNPRAQSLCRALATANGVADRVQIGGRMTHADFAVCTTTRSVVICDIEGAERALLDPTLAPGLLSADMLVEVHDCFQPGLSAVITQRFAATHDILRIDRLLDDQGLPDWMQNLSDLDRLIALWEWRVGATPWLWMVRKTPALRRNAVIRYLQDGYDPVTKGINGRRVAGASFLKGYLRHADTAEFVMLSLKPNELTPVRALVADVRPDVPLRHLSMLRPSGIAKLGTLFNPSPNIAAEAWRRAAYGTGAWSICGITHTTSTAMIMQGFYDLRMAPVMPWDAVICTSKAVQTSVNFQMDLIDAHMIRHLRSQPPPRPMLPVIPLGIHCDDFVPDVAAGQSLRARLGAGPDDVIFTTLARLTPHEKFDPLPIYLAMQAAQRQLPGTKLHIAFCGIFRDGFSRDVFEKGASKLMPDVGFVLLDGADETDRKAALSGSDVFMFLIDNIQETFGLAPIEAMAAGLPLLVSDWDGMRDTVTPDVGFRITTRTLPAGHLAQEALRYLGGIDQYAQYISATAAMTEIDMPELTARIVQLAASPDLRRAMGAAGAARARTVYDWAQIIPQMQDLWGEQDSLRSANPAQSIHYAPESVPIAPSPTALFASYPTEQVTFADTRFIAADLTHRMALAEVLALRNFEALKRVFAPPENISAVLAAVTATGIDGAGLAQIATSARLKRQATERILIWLLKYDFIRRV